MDLHQLTKNLLSFSQTIMKNSLCLISIVSWWQRKYPRTRKPWGIRQDDNNEEEKYTGSCRIINVSSVRLSDAVAHWSHLQRGRGQRFRARSNTTSSKTGIRSPVTSFSNPLFFGRTSCSWCEIALCGLMFSAQNARHCSLLRFRLEVPFQCLLETKYVTVCVFELWSDCPAFISDWRQSRFLVEMQFEDKSSQIWIQVRCARSLTLVDSSSYATYGTGEARSNEEWQFNVAKLKETRQGPKDFDISFTFRSYKEGLTFPLCG